MNTPSTTVVTITKLIAVPRSKTRLRSAMPTATVTSHAPIARVLHSGERQSRSTAHPAATPIMKGAAISKRLPSPRSSSWLRRPIATNATTATRSSTNAIAASRAALRRAGPGSGGQQSVAADGLDGVALTGPA